MTSRATSDAMTFPSPIVRIRTPVREALEVSFGLVI
jgi:hypothetical protein